MNTQYGTGLWTTFVWVGVECCVAMRHSLERGVACCGVVWHAVAWCGMLRMLQQLCRFSSYPSWFSRKKPLRAWGALIYALNSRLFSGYPLNTFTQVLQQSHGLLSWKIYMYIYIYIYISCMTLLNANGVLKRVCHCVSTVLLYIYIHQNRMPNPFCFNHKTQ